MGSVRGTSHAAFGWPPSGASDATAALRAKIAEDKGPAGASSSQVTEAERQRRDFDDAWKQLPEFVRNNGYCKNTANRIKGELSAYNQHIRRPDLKQKILDDINAQRDRISSETLNRLANVKNSAGLNVELERIRKEVDGLIDGSKNAVIPTILAQECLRLQVSIMDAAIKEQPTFGKKELGLVTGMYGEINRLNGVAKRPYEPR
jgi:hypothetical protein